MRDKFIAFIKEWNIPVAAAFTGLLVVAYLIAAAIRTPNAVGATVQDGLATVIFNSFTMVGSLFAFGLVVTLSDESKWGDAKDFRLYVAIGALWGASVSAIFLVKAFFGLFKPVAAAAGAA